MPQTISPSFKARHIIRTFEQTIHADPAGVFDLLCPVKEGEWLDGWDYTLLHSESGLAEEGCVFLSRQEGEKDTIWMITKRDVQKREIEFVRATPESRIARLSIAVAEKSSNRSKVKITYVITALCEEGNKFLEAFTQENFEDGMKFWEASMNYYLETGKKLSRS
ncbi:MAG: hypothetical protein V2I56_23895 [Desulfobacteraceae bacterium]|jgi:hypothetical protein|nr:hypothetical protein [Desulfobacteraceae bacterium]